MSEVSEEVLASRSRWTLIRDIAVLQVKLIVDGLRDLFLVPLSLIAGLVSVLSPSDGENRLTFYRLLALGKQSERWIDLFGAVRNSPEAMREQNAFADASMDELVGRFETLVVEEARRGGITAQAKTRLDNIIDRLQRRKTKQTDT